MLRTLNLFSVKSIEKHKWPFRLRITHHEFRGRFDWVLGVAAALALALALAGRAFAFTLAFAFAFGLSEADSAAFGVKGLHEA